MSWDVWIVNSKEQTPIEEIDGSQLANFGDLDSVIEKIAKVVPEIDWTEKTYAHLDNGDYIGHLGLSVSDQKICTSIMFHVYGGKNPTKTISAVCCANNWFAIDTVTGQYLDLTSPDESGWNQFQEFRKSVQDRVGSKSPASISISRKKWWEFWK